MQTLKGKTALEKLMATLDAGFTVSNARPMMVGAVTDAVEDWRELHGGDD
jgi:hypothetical protein